MKRIISAVLTLCLIVSYGIIAPVNAGEVVTVEPRDQRQVMEGWGTSLAWWGNVVGNWSGNKKNEVIDALFADSGLDMNIVRYNIGGGENPNHEHMRVGAEVPGYQPTQGVWDWTADPGQRWVLHQAIAKGVNHTEAFSNSPPYWMTKSGCAAGNHDGSSNLKPEMYDDFVDYLTTVLKHFKDNWGVTFDTLAVMNEPSSNWWKSSNNQEGCHFERSEQNQLIKLTGQSLQQKGLSQIKISAPEEYSIDVSKGSYESYDATAKSHITQINTHTYGGSDRSGLRLLARLNNLKLWNSEVTLGGSNSHDHNDISSAMEQSLKILDDINNMGVTAWCYWQAVEDEAGGHNHGLIHANFTGTENYWLTKQYYTMGQYTKYVKPGYTIIGTSSGNVLAALDTTGNQLVLVATNNGSGSKDFSFDLSTFTSVGTTATATRTSQNENHQSISSPSIQNGVLSYTAPGKSVTTFVIGNTSYSGNGRMINNSVTGTGTNAFNFTGNWSHGSQSGGFWDDNAWSNSQGASYAVSFNGTSVALYAAKGSNHGHMDILVDGQLKKTVDLYASSRSDQVKVFALDGLSPGSHTITAKVNGQKNGASSGTYIIADRIDVNVPQQVTGANLVTNGGFESGQLSPWQGEWHPDRAGVESTYPSEGTKDAYIHPTGDKDVAIYQTVTLSTSKVYTLSADCATNLSEGVVLGVDVNGQQVGTKAITGNIGYNRYSISFNGKAGDTVKIWYYAKKTSGWATLDGVTLK